MSKRNEALMLVDDRKARSPGIDEKEKIIFGEEFVEHYLDYDKWRPERTYYGGGNNEFQAYLIDNKCLFIKDHTLHIKPQLSGNLINTLWGNFTNSESTSIGGNTMATQCTATQYQLGSPGDGPLDYIAQRNTPCVSGKIRTHDNFWFKYGRVEVEAKLPRGDWLWPAIWLTANRNYYGDWPKSAEIDIVESRGNDPKPIDPILTQLNPNLMPGNKHSNDAGALGNDYVTSTLHWGQRYDHNNYSLSSSAKHNVNGTTEYMIYGLYWTPCKLYTYTKNPKTGEYVKILDMTGGPLDLKHKSLWEMAEQAGSFIDPMLGNPWASSPNNIAPFDTPMSINLNVAVGGFGIGPPPPGYGSGGLNGGYFQYYEDYNKMVNAAAGSPVGQAFLEGALLDRDWYPVWTNGKPRIFGRIKVTTSGIVTVNLSNPTVEYFDPITSTWGPKPNVVLNTTSHITLHSYNVGPNPVIDKFAGIQNINVNGNSFTFGVTVPPGLPSPGPYMYFSILNDQISDKCAMKIKNVRVYANRHTEFSVKGKKYRYDDL